VARRPLRLGLALALAAGALAAPVAAAAPAAASREASGCGVVARAGTTTLRLDVARHERTVVVHVPSGYRDTARTPLVLNLHGTGATAEGQELFSGMDATSDADGFLVAYPQGLIPVATGFAWNVPDEPIYGGSPVPAGSANDVRFLVGLVAALSARYCVAPGAVFATGFSGGARMASQLACDASSTFAAVAPVSGLRRPTPCPTTRPVPVISFHGLEDATDPYAGHGQAYWTYSVARAARDWAAQDGCSAAPAVTRATGYTLTAYRGCAQGSAVELYSIAGEGHEWPGGPVMPARLTTALGPQSFALSANALIWAFFRAHERP
jgi:polyhydroxybutyrate depolymerase